MTENGATNPKEEDVILSIIMTSLHNELGLSLFAERGLSNEEAQSFARTIIRDLEEKGFAIGSFK